MLFSPIAHENLGDPHPARRQRQQRQPRALHQGHEGDRRCERRARSSISSPPSQALYDAAEAPLTLNGVHLLPEGNRRLGEVIATAVTGAKVTATPSLEPLRQAVLDKNWHWHNRYRAMDENDIWGSRSGLRFVAGQTNRDVLQHELTMLDVMTANRDTKIHAVAQGRSHTVDDSNVPKPVEVVSNVGGGGKSSRQEGGKHGLPGQQGKPRQAPCARRLRGQRVRRREDVSRAGQPGADAGGCQGPPLGRLLEHLSEVGTAQGNDRQPAHLPGREPRRRGGQGDRVREGAQPARLRVLGWRRDRGLATRHPFPQGHRRRRQGGRPHRAFPSHRIRRHPPLGEQFHHRPRRRALLAERHFPAAQLRASVGTVAQLHRVRHVSLRPAPSHVLLHRRQRPEPPRHQLRPLGILFATDGTSSKVLPGAAPRRRVQDVPASQTAITPDSRERHHLQRQLPR